MKYIGCSQGKQKAAPKTDVSSGSCGRKAVTVQMSHAEADCSKHKQRQPGRLGR